MKNKMVIEKGELVTEFKDTHCYWLVLNDGTKSIAIYRTYQGHWEIEKYFVNILTQKHTPLKDVKETYSTTINYL